MVHYGRIVKASRMSPTMLLRIASGGWSLHVVCVLVAALLSVSLQTDVQWGTEYPLVPWEDMWQEVEEMTEGMRTCRAEDATCWSATNASSDSRVKVSNICRSVLCFLIIWLGERIL